MNHYQVLGVASTADHRTVRAAYLALARRHHPDRAGGDAARMQAINLAWAVLGDPERRVGYDRALAQASTDRPAPTPAPSRGREGYEPDPAYDPDDDLDLDAWGDDPGGLDPDDRPIRITVVLPRWLRLLPVAALGVAVGAFGVGTVLGSEPLLAFGLMALLLAGLFFLSAPFIALLASRRSSAGDR